jgi:hypothetical protein
VLDARTSQLAPLAAPDGTVPAYTGLIFLTALTASRLLELHVRSPLDACTCLGIDSGAPPLKLDLHADVLAPLTNAHEATYLAPPPRELTSDGRLQAARAVLWHGLRADAGAGEAPSGSALGALGALRLATAANCRYLYLSHSALHHAMLLDPPLSPSLSPADAAIPAATSPTADSAAAGWTSPARPHPPPNAAAASPSLCSYVSAQTAARFKLKALSDGRAVCLGSLVAEDVEVETGSALVHCHLPRGTRVCEGAYLYGITTPPTPTTWPAQ